jgi:ATP-dependent helicase IRC3
MKLRQYQQDAIQAIENKFIDSDRQYIEMPTGSGKTITFLSFAAKHYSYILIIVPSKELLRQVYESALLFWSEDQISRKGAGFNEELSNVHIVIVNSLRQKYVSEIATGEFELIIIDEAHHIQCESYKRAIKEITETQFITPKILGVTATPDRLDGLMIQELLYDCSYKVSIEKLIAENHLSDIEGYCIKTNVDLSDIDDHNGDFSITQLYKKLSTQTRNNLIVEICKCHMKDRKTLIFCINVDHAKEISALLNSLGLYSRAIFGDMCASERKSILDSFRSGEISFLCNCQLLTEGFDEPAIDGIIIARPTRSRSLFMQMVGRGLRKFPGKLECKIIDIVDNHRALASFSSLLDEGAWKQLESFKGIAKVRENIEKQILENIETKIVRSNLFNIKFLDEEPMVDAMKEYLEENEITYYGLISYEEASFLIWFNELKKKVENGND